MGTGVYRIIGIVLLVLSIAGYIYSKITELEDTIETYEATITKYVESEEKLKLTIALKDADINTLSVQLDKYSKYVDTLHLEYQAVMDDLTAWENKPPEIRYKYIYKTLTIDKDKIDQGDCLEGLKLNREISEMKYLNIGVNDEDN